MKAIEIRKKSDKELTTMIDEHRQKIASFKRERFVNDERNIRLISQLRKDLARLLTEERERQDSDEVESANKTPKKETT